MVGKEAGKGAKDSGCVLTAAFTLLVAALA